MRTVRVHAARHEEWVTDEGMYRPHVQPLHPLVSDPLLVTGGMDRTVRMFNPYIPSSVTHSS